MRLSLYRKLSTDKKLQRIRQKIKLVQLDLMTGIHSRTVNTGYKKLFTYIFTCFTRNYTDQGALHCSQEITSKSITVFCRKNGCKTFLDEVA